MIHRTISATCDVKVCPATVVLSPDSAQPFRDLFGMGWSNVVDEACDGVLTYCPDHTTLPSGAR